MAEAARRAREWLSPSRIIAVTVLGSIPVKLFTDKIIDPDLWWHLRTGQLIVATHKIPRVDLYSFTIPGEPWVVQEWLSEVLLHGLHRAFGLYGILIFRAVVLFAIYAVIARLLVRRMGSGMGTWALLGLGAYAGSANWTERPNLLSYLLFAVLLTLLERKDSKIWWFVPLATLWANLHGMVILGIATVFLVTVSEAAKVYFRRADADSAWARRLGLVGLASCAAVLLNPNGFGLIAHAFRLLSVVRGVVTEWASPDFHEASSLLFLALMLLTIAAWALTREPIDLTDLALGLAFMFLGLQAVRNLILSAIVLILVAARALPGAIESLRRSNPRERISSQPSVPLGVMGLAMTAGGFALLLATGLPRSNAFADVVDPKFPVGAIDAIERPGVRLFVLDGWSGLVIERTWPAVKVFVDLRVDTYGADLVLQYRRAIASLPGWDTTLSNACVTHVLIAPDQPLAETLQLTSTWERIRADEVSVTYQRVRPAPGCEAHPIPDVR